MLLPAGLDGLLVAGGRAFGTTSGGAGPGSCHALRRDRLRSCSSWRAQGVCRWAPDPAAIHLCHLPASAWTEVSARHFARKLTERKLTEDELKTAATYFPTKSGIHFMSAIRDERDARRRGDSSFRRKEHDERRDSEFQAFLKTSAGRKFLTPGSADDSAWSDQSINEIAQRRIAEALAACPKS